MTKVTVHVGVNSCYDGAVSEDTWSKLLTQLTRVFPKATIQASSIIPPKTPDHLLSPVVKTSNANLRDVCQKRKVTLVDNYPIFAQDILIIFDLLIDLVVNIGHYFCPGFSSTVLNAIK